MLGALKHGALRLNERARVQLVRGSGPQPDRFDSEYGTDTATTVSVGALDIPNDKLEQANRYEAISPESFDRVVGELFLRHEEYVFVDIGSGKGRALLLASFYPFRRVVGVEISPALTQIAEDNIKTFRDPKQKCKEITALCIDGAAYELPRQNCVLYLYNPFGLQVMRSFVSAVEKSIWNQPRKIFVIYFTPTHRAPWDQSEVFRPIRESVTLVVYESR